MISVCVLFTALHLYLPHSTYIRTLACFFHGLHVLMCIIRWTTVQLTALLWAPTFFSDSRMAHRFPLATALAVTEAEKPPYVVVCSVPEIARLFPLPQFVRSVDGGHSLHTKKHTKDESRGKLRLTLGFVCEISTSNCASQS